MKIHIVQKGDTLWEIANKYGVDFEQLKELNSHLASPDMIMPGMKIRIPTQSKKIAKEDKTQVLPKEKSMPKKTAPPIKDTKTEEKSLELPKMPTFPMEEEDTLPIMEEKKQEYPTKILPELPKSPKPKAAPPPKGTQEPPKMPPPQEYVAPAQDECMPFMGMPVYPQPQMLPMMPCPCPCHGMMPIQYDPCGCGGGHGHPMPMYGMPQPMYQPQGIQAYPGSPGYPSGMHQAYPQTMGQQMGNQGQQAGMHAAFPQMYPGMESSDSQMNTGQEAYQQPTENGPFYSNPSMRMFPQPPGSTGDAEKSGKQDINEDDNVEED